MSWGCWGVSYGGHSLHMLSASTHRPEGEAFSSWASRVHAIFPWAVPISTTHSGLFSVRDSSSPYTGFGVQHHINWVLMNTCNPSTQEVKTGWSEVHSHPCLHEFKASLSYMWFCLLQNRKMKRKKCFRVLVSLWGCFQKEIIMGMGGNFSHGLRTM